MKNISSFFTSDGQAKALEAYGAFAKNTAWSVPMKMDLYARSLSAFSGDGDCAVFEEIYKNLVSYWQVFRPHGASESWDAPRIFDEMRRALVGFDRGSGCNLMNFADERRGLLVERLGLLGGMKPNAGYPVMTVSKFVHFFNPSLFPIYDSTVVDQMVLRRFWDDFEQFCKERGLSSAATGADVLGNYVSWASSLIRGSDPDFMKRFVAWLGSELPPKKLSSLDTSYLETLYATAFEFTVIGAAAISKN